MQNKLQTIENPELLREESLWQIFKASQSIKDSRFNWIVGLVIVAVFVVYGCIEQDTLRVHTLLLKMGEIGINAAITILGFLIAGFTVFATVARPQLFLMMALKRHPKSQLSFLKHNFFTFMRVFIYWLVFAALELLIVVFGQRDSVLAAFSASFPVVEDGLYWGNRLMLTISAATFAFVFLQLKSFVFNTYHVVMTVIEFDRNQEPKS